MASAHIFYTEDTYLTNYFISELKSGMMVGTGIDYFFNSKVGVGLDFNRYSSKDLDAGGKMTVTFIGTGFIYNSYWRKGVAGISLRGSVGYFNYYLKHYEIPASALRGDGVGVKFEPAFHIQLFPKAYIKFGTPFYIIDINNLKDINGVLYDNVELTNISRLEIMVGFHVKL
jgi:hypothetical protein